jgi:hypothetical protein
MKQPSYQAYIPARPTEAEYQALVEEFWWGTTYVAKSLWRDELVFAKWVLDQDLKLETMRRMLEWRIEIDHHWSVKPGIHVRMPLSVAAPRRSVFMVICSPSGGSSLSFIAHQEQAR